jgi:hypothetical protein
LAFPIWVFGGKCNSDFINGSAGVYSVVPCR